MKSIRAVALAILLFAGPLAAPAVAATPTDAEAAETLKRYGVDPASPIESRIGEARDACRCGEPSCTKTLEAMSQLESLVSSVDGAIRGGGPMPLDAPQQQEQIDQTIDAARNAAR